MGNLFDRKNKLDTEAEATSQAEKSSKVNFEYRLRICFIKVMNVNRQLHTI